MTRRTIGGHYEIVRSMGGAGRSGMGEVFLVTAEDAPEPFVMKTYQGETSRESEEDFRKEALGWVAIGTHPNIVKAHWVRRIDRRTYVAAEFVEGFYGLSTVRDLIESDFHSDGLILRLAAQVCDALVYASTRGMVAHQDIKPENLLLTPAGDIKVADFGLAHCVIESLLTHFVEAEEYEHPDEGMQRKAVGTAPYMAPELWLSAGEVDGRSDQYAFGVVLYELITGGQYPYDLACFPEPQYQTVERYFSAHLDSAPRAVEHPLWPIVERCLRKEPAARFRSFAELRSSLEAIAAQRAISMPPNQSHYEDRAADLYSIAQSAMALGRKEEALQAIERHCREFPDLPWGYTEKSRICLELGRNEEAAKAARESLNIDPENSHAWNNLGVAEARMNNHRVARECYSQAIQINPLNAGAYSNGATNAYAEGNAELASHLIKKAIALCPESENYHFNANNMARELVKSGKLETGLSLLEYLNELRPGDTQTVFNLAVGFDHAKDVTKATQYWKEVLEFEPDNELAQERLSALASQSRDAWNRTSSERARSVESIVGEARGLIAEGKTERALELIRASIWSFPSTDALLFVYANLLEQLGDVRNALAASYRCRDVLVDKKIEARCDNLRQVGAMIGRLRRIADQSMDSNK